MAQVHIDLPGAPEYDIEVPGLGVFPGNGTYEVSEDQIATFNIVWAPHNSFPEDGELYIPQVLPVEDSPEEPADEVAVEVEKAPVNAFLDDKEEAE